MKPEKEDQSSYIPLNLDTRSSAREPAKWHRICILIISFMLVMLGAGLSHSYGVFLVYFVNEKVVTPTEGAWAIGLEQFFFYGTGFFVLPLIEKIGWRVSTLLGTLLAFLGLLLSSFATGAITMYITYGIMTGVGLGVVFILAYIVTEDYWINDLYVGIAIIATGFDTGLMAFGPLLQVLLDNIGWRSTQRVLAAMCLFGLSGVVAFKPLPANSQKQVDKDSMEKIDHNIPSETTSFLAENVQKQADSRGSLVDRFVEIWRFYCQIDFLFFSFAYFCYTWSYDAPFTFLPTLAESYNIPSTKASTLLTLFGVSGIVTRIMTLLIPGKKLSMPVIGLLVAFLVSGLSSLLTPLCYDYTTLVVYSLCIGSTLAYMDSTFVFITVVLMGKEHKEQITTGLYMFNALADISNGPASGALIEAMSSPVSPFVMAGCVGILGTILYCIAIFHKRTKIKGDYEE